MKNKKKFISKLCVIIIIIVIIETIVFIHYKGVCEIELTQLSSQTGNRMMGYIIRTSDDKTIVIDGGLDTDANNLVNNIEKYGNTVDYWFVTHPHMDHAGAFVNIINNENINLDIKNIYYSANSMEWYNEYASDRVAEVKDFYNALDTDKIKNIEYQPNIGDEINIGENLKIKILGINNPEITTNPINNSSMVFKVYFNNRTILFLGDTGKESSEKLINIYGNKLKSDIVQVAHHGQGGATEELYKLVAPTICLWPTPEWLWNNNSGSGYDSGSWTTLETRKWMDNLGVHTNYVAKDGDITIRLK